MRLVREDTKLVNTHEQVAHQFILPSTSHLMVHSDHSLISPTHQRLRWNSRATGRPSVTIFASQPILSYQHPTCSSWIYQRPLPLLLATTIFF